MLGQQMALVAERLLDTYGSNYCVFSDDTTMIGQFKGIETKFQRYIFYQGIIQQNDQVYYFARVANIGELVEVDDQKLYTKFVETKRLQNTNIISRIVVTK